MTELDLRELLAALEHEQWMAWANHIMDTEPISEERKNRWQHFMVPYADLDEITKEFDRVWADRVLHILSKWTDEVINK
jgi:hypothetical protein